MLVWTCHALTVLAFSQSVKQGTGITTLLNSVDSFPFAVREIRANGSRTDDEIVRSRQSVHVMPPPLLIPQWCVGPPGPDRGSTRPRTPNPLPRAARWPDVKPRYPMG
jgi:hypothetical protein